MEASSGWWPVVQVLEKRYSCLSRLCLLSKQVHGKDSHISEKLPDLLKICIALGVQGLEVENKKPLRLAMIAPRWGEGAFWTAFGIALCALKNDFERAQAHLPDFAIGQKLLLDKNKVVQYEGEDAEGLRLRDRDGVLILKEPLSYRLRLQPTNSSKRLSLVPFAGVAKRDLLDDLLDIKCQGARHIFSTRVVLVSSVIHVMEAARHILVSPYAADSDGETFIDPLAFSEQLLNLFQWGSLRLDGALEIKSAGQIEADPVLLVCPELLPLRQFLRDKTLKSSSRKEQNAFTPPLVVLNGAASFRNQLDVINGVLDSSAPVLACLEHGEEEAIKPLVERAFEVWRWNSADIGELVHLPETGKPAGILFSDWKKSLHNYSRNRLQEHVCTHNLVHTAADELMVLLSGLDPTQSETKTLEGVLYGSLLHVARQLHRSEGDMEARLQERLNRARDEITRCGFWLTDETRTRANSILHGIAEASRMQFHEGKMAALQSVVRESSSPTVAVVVAEAEAVELTRRQWLKLCRADGTLALKKVSFCCPTTVEAHLSATKAGHLVVCGWLGAGRMRRLLDGCLAADISLLLYPFERGWLGAALRRWRGKIIPMTNAQKVHLLGISGTSLKIALPEERADIITGLQDEVLETETKLSAFDAGEFEMRLRVHRRASLASAGRPDEEVEAARLVEFSGGHFAFLSDSCRLPVVNDLMQKTDAATDTASTRKSELPQKRCGELVVGDYVVFRRGTAGNLIRDIADIRLRRAGHGQARALSGLWKVALREWVEAERERALQTGSDDSQRAVIRKLQKSGIERGELTIRYWLEQDRVIGPRDPETTLDTLARVTGHEELKRKLPAVVEAISRVHSAHLTASDYLARTLISRLPAHLANSIEVDSFRGGVLEVEIAGVGAAVVVRVEEIADEMAPVARSQINVLQREPEESQSLADVFETC